MRQLVKVFEEMKSLDKPAEQVSARVRRFIGSSPGRKRVGDFLHGNWLGHPLHPMLTDLPIGFWTAASTLDLAGLGRKKSSAAATSCVAIGVMASLPTAAAGLMDWHHLSGKTKRVGAGHALLNSAALGCYVLSLISRLSGGSGRGFGFLGLGIVTASGYLGADLIYDSKVGVKHSPDTTAPASDSYALLASELQDGERKRIEIDGFSILLYRDGARIYAVSDTCTHLGCSLVEGQIDAGKVTCGCHGSTFSLSDGRVLSGPAVFPLDVFSAQMSEGRIEVGRPA